MIWQGRDTCLKGWIVTSLAMVTSETNNSAIDVSIAETSRGIRFRESHLIENESGL